MNDTDAAIDQRTIKALGHPLRIELLTLLHRKESSPSDLAEELGQPLANVSYHIRLLAEWDCIELVRTAQRRGAIEHYYRARARPFLDEGDWGELPPTLRRSVSAAALKQIWRDTRAAAEDGSLDSRSTRHLTRLPLVVDEKGFDEINTLLTETLGKAERIQSESMKRLKGDGDGELSSRLVLMHYEMPSKGGARKQSQAKPRRRGSK